MGPVRAHPQPSAVGLDLRALYWERTYPIAALISASEAGILGWPLPSFSFDVSVSATPLSPLYFAATSLKADPSYGSNRSAIAPSSRRPGVQGTQFPSFIGAGWRPC